MAQTPIGSAPDGMLAITANEVRRHVDVMAHDSMQGRNTPSPGLEMTAQYVASQFQALGLQPAGDPRQAWFAMHGLPVNADEIPWRQLYQVPGAWRAAPNSALKFTARLMHSDAYVVDERGQPVDQTTRVSFDTAARFAVDTIPESGGGGGPMQARMQVLSGRHTPTSLRRVRLDPAVVLYVPPGGLDSTAEHEVLRTLTATSHVVVLANEDSAAFAARRVRAIFAPPVVIDKAHERSFPSHWAAYVWPEAVRDFLRLSRLDLEQLRTDTTPRVREVPSVGVLLAPWSTLSDSSTGMNVAAMLSGTDSLMRDQLIVLSAHMDNIGVTPGSPARIHKGTNDNASGVAGLLALAKAFSRPGARPKRPLLFVATSGGARDKRQWGADAFAEPLSDDVAYASLNLTLDMIGRVPGDSLVVNGLADFDFATRPDWLAAQHPELGMRLVDGGTSFAGQSDHLAFLRRAIPSLYVHAANHDNEQALDALDGVDAEQEVRALRMLYYLIQDFASGRRLPRWTSASRDQRARFFGR